MLETSFTEPNLPDSTPSKIHIRLQQRSARTNITIIEGIDSSFDLLRILRDLKRKFNCNGSIATERYSIIQLSGDKRLDVKEFLQNEGIASPEDIVIHGY